MTTRTGKKIAEEKEAAVKRAYEKSRRAEAAKPSPEMDGVSESQRQFYDSVFRKDGPAKEGTKRGARDRKGAAPQGGLKNSKAEARWKLEEKRRIAEQAEKREIEKAKKKRERERRETHKMLAQRSSKGRPVIKNVVGHLLSQLEKQQQ